MTKLDWILLFVLPGLRTASQILRNKDKDSVGADDIAADAIDLAIKKLEEYQATKGQS